MQTTEKLNKLGLNAADAMNNLMNFIHAELSNEVTPFDVLEYVDNKFRVIPTLPPCTPKKGETIRNLQSGK